MNRRRWKEATREDILSVVSDLRDDDEAECRAMWGISPDQLFRSVGYNAGSDTYVIFNSEGENVALAGVAPTADPKVGQVWMIATPKLENHQIEFLRYTRHFIDEITKDYDLVFNWVDARNTVHIKWLKWCGFTFISKRDKWGAEGRTFYEFVKVVSLPLKKVT